MAAAWLVALLSASWASSSSSNMSPSASFRCSKIYLLIALFSSRAFSSSGPLPSWSFFSFSMNSFASLSEPSSSSAFVTKVGRTLSPGPSPFVIHFAMSASRRALLSASLRSTSSSLSCGMNPSTGASSSLSFASSVVSISSRQLFFGLTSSLTGSGTGFCGSPSTTSLSFRRFRSRSRSRSRSFSRPRSSFLSFFFSTLSLFLFRPRLLLSEEETTRGRGIFTLGREMEYSTRAMSNLDN
mmetsp:Transcript_89808/g.187712  ORF Transcript_89808/g.187712 Transcript_89808/m.187712 type:complete len:241 (-) Transcript_89808:375-1097(-)